MAAENGNGNGNGRLSRLLESAVKWLVGAVVAAAFALAGAAYQKACANEAAGVGRQATLQLIREDLREVKADVKDLLRRSK